VKILPERSESGFALCHPNLFTKTGPLSIILKVRADNFETVLQIKIPEPETGP
jgi:hypothetical protein